MLTIFRTLKHYKPIVLLALLEIAVSFALTTNMLFLLVGHIQRIKLNSGLVDNELVSIKATGSDDAMADASLRRTDLHSLRELSNVSSVAQINALPFSKILWTAPIYRNGNDREPLLRRTPMYVGTVGFLQVMGIAITKGRDFSIEEFGNFNPLNGDHVPPVGIISTALANKLWPDGDAVGRILYLGDKKNPVRVIGITAPVASPDFHDLDDSGINIFFPATSVSDGLYLVRGSKDQRDRILEEATKVLYQNDAGRIVLAAAPYTTLVTDFFLADRSAIRISTSVIACLLILTCLGIVALSSLWVAQRTRHIGIRRALGARRSDVFRYLLTENIIIVSAGGALGALCSLALNLYVMQYSEIGRIPAEYLISGMVLFALIGQLSVLVPALRASQINPIRAIRN